MMNRMAVRKRQAVPNRSRDDDSGPPHASDNGTDPSDPERDDPPGANGQGRQQLRQVRLADIVAATLRSRILSGELPDGSLVPKQEDLGEEYLVSPAAIREALRILETEGLVSVMRGSIGGSVVHTPRP